ncbi:molybdenum cofactor guanylyltransferase [Pseudohongiella acticola]|uniref:molybdenum cofactor guanylyltransferase n=1 Tax=Pseudohongiella acticola TaxID=1524254 RepID=UPI0030ED13D6
MPAFDPCYTLIVLAGGQGSRMGGCDKGMLTLGQQTFAELLVHRLRCSAAAFNPGYGPVLISANRNQQDYGRIGAQVCADLRPDFQGPLAGLEAALSRASPDLPAVIVPCDMPLLPDNLPAGLLRSVMADQRSVAVLHDGHRRQHLCLALWPKSALFSIRQRLDENQRSVAGWLAGQLVADVTFSEESVGALPFACNINRTSDLAQLPG